ncbi:MAG: hypothetical protein ACR2QF_09160 [Geminicoccaceae bacterium]
MSTEQLLNLRAVLAEISNIAHLCASESNDDGAYLEIKEKANKAVAVIDQLPFRVVS